MNNTLKILLLEDNPEDAEIIQRLLMKEKPASRFQLATTEQEFLRALDVFNPDVVISDNSLPGYNAVDALLVFKKRALTIPFILVTGTISDEDAAVIMQAGADDYLLKDRLVRLPAAVDTALQKKRLESERKQAEELIRFKVNLLKSVGQAVIATDINGMIIYWNDAAEKIYGWSSNEALNKNIAVLISSYQSTGDEEEAIMSDLKMGKTWSGESMVIRKNGSAFPAIVSRSPFYDENGKLIGFISVSFDITKQKLSEQTILSMEKQIASQKIREQKIITRALIKGQEEEKNRIGKELHDNINQILVGAKLYLGIAGQKNAELEKLAKYPIELIDASIEEIRLLTNKQVTPLKNINLSEQVNRLLENSNKSGNHSINLTLMVEESSLSDDLKINIYRIVQEQINNILKHAAATTINISITEEAKALNIMIQDDGIGFDPAQDRKGIGISNMINRVESYDGSLLFESSPGNGCTLHITIPC